MKITIDRIPPYDGEYELDPYSLTLREKRRMKEVSGLAGLEVTEALLKGDPDATIGFAIAALERKYGRRQDENLLLDAEGGEIRLDFTPSEGDDDVPLAKKSSSDETGSD